MLDPPPKVVGFFVVMPARLTREQFIEKAKGVWGERYDLSFVEYKGNKERVKIYCRDHGFFSVIPNDFLRGHGCDLCGRQKKKSLVQGVGINDEFSSRNDVCKRIWTAMLVRCYSKKNLERNPTYENVFVCEDWKRISRFRKWFEKNYTQGYQLDKDIICKGNKLYSPETCCFVPQEINKIITSGKSRRGDYPVGVHVDNNSGKITAHINKNGQNKHIGVFSTIEEAFYAYKTTKENYIKEVAQEYFDKGLITERVRDALFRYKIEITD